MTVFLNAVAAAGLCGKPGKQAIKAEYRKQVKLKRPAGCTGSVDLDAHFEKIEPDANRWDYGVGFKKADADRDFVSQLVVMGLRPIRIWYIRGS